MYTVKDYYDLERKFSEPTKNKHSVLFNINIPIINGYTHASDIIKPYTYNTRVTGTLRIIFCHNNKITESLVNDILNNYFDVYFIQKRLKDYGVDKSITIIEDKIGEIKKRHINLYDVYKTLITHFISENFLTNNGLDPLWSTNTVKNICHVEWIDEQCYLETSDQVTEYIKQYDQIFENLRLQSEAFLDMITIETDVLYKVDTIGECYLSLPEAGMYDKIGDHRYCVYITKFVGIETEEINEKVIYKLKNRLENQRLISDTATDKYAVYERDKQVIFCFNSVKTMMWFMLSLYPLTIIDNQETCQIGVRGVIR